MKNFKFTQQDFNKFFAGGQFKFDSFFKEMENKGFQFSPEQKSFFQNQDLSNLSFPEFKERVLQSKLFAGFFDFS